MSSCGLRLTASDTHGQCMDKLEVLLPTWVCLCSCAPPYPSETVYLKPGVDPSFLLLRCLWRRHEVVSELHRFCEQWDLCFTPHGCHPPQAINQVRTPPQGFATPHGPHGECHPPHWCASPHSPRCMARLAAAKYFGLWGQISRFFFLPVHRGFTAPDLSLKGPSGEEGHQ